MIREAFAQPRWLSMCGRKRFRVDGYGMDLTERRPRASSPSRLMTR